MNKFTQVFLSLMIFISLNAQNIPLPDYMPQSHPRLMICDEKKDELIFLINNEEWANNIEKDIKKRIEIYVEKTQEEPDWVYSRLMMYWKSRSTNVYIKGGIYSHSDGEAPVATVRFGSTRGVPSSIVRPKLENIIPYMDDRKGVYFHNTSKINKPLEWCEHASVSGSHIENVNNEILRIGRDGAFMAWLRSDDKYGKFAFDILDTYLNGIYYRNPVVDLNNGHAQTLAGITTFEVIQEHIIPELACYYDFLYGYIDENYPEKKDVFEASLKKMIDQTIKNGVPHNNWNLHQAKIILPVAMVLEDDSCYSDGKGRQYYIDYILNRSTSRQWSLKRFLEYGYDFNNAIWNECPGYAQGVIRDLTNFVIDYDNTFNQNLLPYYPVMEKAVEVLPQYMFPNRLITAFGDTYYGEINYDAILNIIRLAQKYNNYEMEEKFISMYKIFNNTNSETDNENIKVASQVNNLFNRKPLNIDNNVVIGDIRDYISQTFYAPNVSWFVQRNKFEDEHNGMMISQYASLGNHAHSNGLAIELYGKGFVLAPESGIGSTYFQAPYLEYYSQFPAHNTVMVDGISKYPEMLSNHPFQLLANYPESGKKNGYYEDITYSDAYFLEPESQSDQRRLLSIVSTGDSTGYYVDIFRSKKQKRGDKFHDYFYHNLGQELLISDVKGQELVLKENDEMAFAGGHLFALDYMWDKKSAKTQNDYMALWKMGMDDGNNIYMNLWMKNYPEREIYSIKSPPCKSFRNNEIFPYEVTNSPFLTIAARQHGEAWNKPFVSVFEPFTEYEGKSIDTIYSFVPGKVSEDFLGIIVQSKSGRKDLIFSSVSEEVVCYNNIISDAVYSLISEKGNDRILFLGNGKMLSNGDYSIESKTKTNAVLEFKNGELYLSCESPVLIKLKGKKKKIFPKQDYQKIKI